MTTDERSAFGGTIGRTVAESTPWWPTLPDVQRPNIVLVVLDDTGWSDLAAYGSEISTPASDRLADEGVQYNNFHVTPLCSPTRASLATGLGHHQVGLRFLAVTDTGFPNSRGELPRDVVTVPARLRDRGYATFLVGKWHLAPQHQLSPAGPYHNWPLARGFDRFYGFLSGAADHYSPELFDGNSSTSRPDDPDYHLSVDLVDHAIGLVRDHLAFRSDDPFFLQLAFGATHAPFQAPEEYIAPYEEIFAKGWERTRQDRLSRQIELGVIPPDTQLTEHDPDVPRWDDLTTDERRVAVRTQAAYAGFLEHADAQLGRLLAALEQDGVLDSTLVVLLSDNGAAGDGGRIGATSVVAPYGNLERSTAEELTHVDAVGGPDGPAHYATGWAMASNTPFRLYKQYVDLGGVRSPLVMRWPGRTGAGGLRSQYAHVVDVAATLLDAAGLAEDLDGLDGVSLLDTLADPAAPEPRREQHYELLGHRAIWVEGWKAVTRHRPGQPFDQDVWRLYDTTQDFSEQRDLSTRHPDRLAMLEQRWWELAEQYGVLPLDDRTLKQMLDIRMPGGMASRRSLRLRPGHTHLTFAARLGGSDRSMRVTAHLLDRTPGDEGALVSSGLSYGGYVLYVIDERLVYEHVLLGRRDVARSFRPLPTGNVAVGFSLVRGKGRTAKVTLFIDESEVGDVTLPRTAMQPSFYGLDIGRDPGSPVAPAYADRGEFPYPCRGLDEVRFDFDGAQPDNGTLAHLHEANQ